MNIALIIILPLVAVALIMLPIITAILRKRSGKTVHPKRAVVTNIASFFGVMLTMTILPLTGAFAASPETTAAAVQTGSDGLKYLAAALSTGLGSIAAGIAVGAGAPAAIGAISENEKSFSKALVFVALGEGVAIYGLLISILILFG
ncbi:MAG: ATP synthase subunit C [Oscillospiraceae bacterium]